MSEISSYMKALFFAGHHQPVEPDSTKFGLSGDVAKECQSVVRKLLEAVHTQGDILLFCIFLMLNCLSLSTMVC